MGDNGEYVDLENIITDLDGSSVFTSLKTCDGAGTNTGAPDTTQVIVDETESTSDGSTTVVETTSDEETTTTVVVGQPESGAKEMQHRAWLYVGCILVAALCL